MIWIIFSKILPRVGKRDIGRKLLGSLFSLLYVAVLLMLLSMSPEEGQPENMR